MLPEDGLWLKHVVTNKIIHNTQGCVSLLFLFLNNKNAKYTNVKTFI